MLLPNYFMRSIKIIFFGSTADSVLVLEKLFTFHFSLFTSRISAVVTQPPRPVGRKQILTPTPVELWAREHGITVLSFPTNREKPWEYEDNWAVIDALMPCKADFLVSACYGQKIPWESIQSARLGGLNVHPSILPHWRGADPVPWAILAGDHQSGVTVVTLAEEFDDGRIIAQKKVPIEDADMSDALRTKLFTIGADLLMEILPEFLVKTYTTHHPRLPDGQASLITPYARRLCRDDGFLSWDLLKAAMDGAPISTIQQYTTITIVKDYLRFQNDWAKEKSLGVILERFFRALVPWPGIWTEIVTKDKEQETGNTKKRLKILACHLSPDACYLIIDTVQLEGKNPVAWAEFTKGYQLLS